LIQTDCTWKGKLVRHPVTEVQVDKVKAAFVHRPLQINQAYCLAIKHATNNNAQNSVETFVILKL
jgi:hypothetical protein